MAKYTVTYADGVIVNMTGETLMGAISGITDFEGGDRIVKVEREQSVSELLEHHLGINGAKAITDGARMLSLEEGYKIPAIKLIRNSIRDAEGNRVIGLKDAKDFVDALG